MNPSARDGAIGPVDQCSAPTEDDFRSSETSNSIHRMLFEPGKALFAQKIGIQSDAYFCTNKSARRDSNPRPRPWQGRAPPTEPLAHFLVTSSVTSIIIYDVIAFVNTYFELFSKFLKQFILFKKLLRFSRSNTQCDSAAPTGGYSLSH